MPPFKTHIFICTNQRSPDHPRGCCAAKGAEDLRNYFKAELKKRGLHSHVRANAAGCLDWCEHGPTVVVYPEGVWYQVKTRQDIDEIITQHIESGKIVDRLAISSSRP